MYRLIVLLLIFLYVPVINACELSPNKAQELMQLSLEKFDYTPNDGWRPYSESGCNEVAIKLIAMYIKEHGEVKSLSFHLGQLYLRVNQYDSAKESFKKSLSKTQKETDILKWNEFVYSYIYYIEKDSKKLQKQIEVIEAGSDFWGNKANLKVANLLLKNINNLYADILKLME